MYFVGHTKFSVYSPQSGAWKASNGSRFKTERDYRNYLFSDERLSNRIDIFINYSLPQLALASQGHHVAHLISYSELLPTKYEEMLQRAAEQYSFIVLERQQSGVPHIVLEDLCRQTLKGSSDPQQPFGIFRLDDDDLLPADYFEQNVPYIRSEFVGMQISLGEGISAIYQDGQFFNARKVYHPMLSIGYMSVHRFDADGIMSKIPAVPHSKSDRHYPVIMDSRRIGFFWTRHTEQDTVLGLVESDAQSRVESLKRHMNTHPAAHDIEEVLEAFPTLRDKITSASDPMAKHVELIPSPADLSSAGLHLKVEKASGEVSVSSTLYCDMSSIPRSALISFIFVDSNGLRIDPESLDDALEGQSIRRSGSARVGWFRYVGTKPGLNRSKLSITLPHGVFVGAVRVLRWGSSKSKIAVRSVSVESRTTS